MGNDVNFWLLFSAAPTILAVCGAVGALLFALFEAVA